MKDTYVAALVEDMNGKFALIMETLDPIKRDVASIKRTLAEMRADLDMHQPWLNDHEMRTTSLENTA